MTKISNLNDFGDAPHNIAPKVALCAGLSVGEFSAKFHVRNP